MSILGSTGRDEREMGERGTTTIADRAVERVAAQVLEEIDGIGGSARRMLGMTVGAANETRSAEAHAHVTGHTASLDVRLSISYPLSVARTCEQARSHLTRRVAELTGLTVSWVDITVTALHSDRTRGRTVR